jgi:hypothetical protein
MLAMHSDQEVYNALMQKALESGKSQDQINKALDQCNL